MGASGTKRGDGSEGRFRHTVPASPGLVVRRARQGVSAGSAASSGFPQYTGRWGAEVTELRLRRPRGVARPAALASVARRCASPAGIARAPVACFLASETCPPGAVARHCFLTARAAAPRSSSAQLTLVWRYQLFRKVKFGRYKALEYAGTWDNLNLLEERILKQGQVQTQIQCGKQDLFQTAVILRLYILKIKRVGRKPRWVRLWRRGKSRRRGGLKRRSQARSPAATMAERPEDLNLPNAVITRIIKEALPDGVNISKEARSAISRATSVFVLYATSCANNFAMKGKRKTLNASDVLSAMEETEFQRFVTPLNEALEAYKREQKGKNEASEQKKKDKDKRTDSEEQDKSRDEDNDENEERLEEEEQNKEEEVDN
ncbi:hypothetical protein R6Z07M_005576 [Ovis aries]